ncbi:hypothetical protein [Azospirillum sp. A39]|uniref:hypothetical protein n=1 Tax=Azospirillum sp. A39 TaxID=3462279 RepID=UPI004045AD95
MSGVSLDGVPPSGVDVGTWSCVARVRRVENPRELAGATVFDAIEIGDDAGRTATLQAMSAGNNVAACLREGAVVEMWVVEIESGGGRGGIVYAARPAGGAAPESGVLAEDLSLVELFAAAARERARRQIITGLLLLPILVGAIFIHAGLRSRRLAAMVPPVDALRAGLPA